MATAEFLLGAACARGSEAGFQDTIQLNSMPSTSRLSRQFDTNHYQQL